MGFVAIIRDNIEQVFKKKINTLYPSFKLKLITVNRYKIYVNKYRCLFEIRIDFEGKKVDFLSVDKLYPTYVINSVIYNNSVNHIYNGLLEQFDKLLDIIDDYQDLTNSVNVDKNTMKLMKS